MTSGILLFFSALTLLVDRQAEHLAYKKRITWLWSWHKRQLQTVSSVPIWG